MKKILLLLLISPLFFELNAQNCCNVISGGISVLTSNGVCVVTASSGENCMVKAPDSDGDGFADTNDKCPHEAGTNNGCPELMEEEKAVLAAALEGVKFKTNSDELLPESLPRLDAVVNLMKKHPDFSLKISGYTDSSGDKDYNLKLSDQRSHSAEKYIISQGIASSRISAKGYGEANAIADNNTAEGKAKNRRVEFELITDF
ncbi:MAG: OmpA family protein [Bacteroidota bacterium]